MAVVLRGGHIIAKRLRVAGFALPTILISSIVMLTMLLVGVTSTSTTRVALQSQYLEQLAHSAGDAGVAYAKACLNANGGVPQWSNGSPLRPYTDCTGANLAGITCPDGVTTFYSGGTPAICSVTNVNNVRSSFSVSLPALDADGKATTIPNGGYAQLIRASTGATWRTYTQQATQAAAAPSLCSGAATSALGWSAAVKTTTAAFPDPGAIPITIATGSINPGPLYFRKDFNVVTSGTYTLKSMGDDQSDVFIDSNFVLRTSGSSSVGTATPSLTPGCHTLFVKVTNYGYATNTGTLTLSLKTQNASIPLVVSDTSWRVSAGNAYDFSSSKYYTDTSSWGAVRDMMSASAANGGWLAATGNSTARWISTTHSYDGSGNYPSAQYVAFRDMKDVTVATPTQVKIGNMCDDSCTLVLDGNIIGSGANVAGTTTLTLSEGAHRFGIILYNTSGPSAFMLSVVRVSDSVTLTNSDPTWLALPAWSASLPSIYSYDNSYVPNPNPVSTSNSIQLLVVGGGGGGGANMGGGGGGGGVVYNSAYTIKPGAYPVTVGAGGSGAPAATGSHNTIAGTNGGNSIFDSIIAFGGGRGGFSLNTTIGPGISYGVSGGSGGGASGYNNDSSALGTVTGGLGVPGQGNNGGNQGVAYYSGGGGGAGGAGASGNAQANGGIGVSNSILGTVYYWGGGGGGSGYSIGGGNGGAGGGGGGAIGVTTGGSGLNAGSAGTNGAVNAQSNVPGGNGGANTGGGGGGGSHYNATNQGGNGGSGIVVISYPTGSMTATGGTITTNAGRTIHTFLSSGTFTIVSIP